ncbi:MAG: HNH endonuclease signature motif containing protein [Candidatus Gastranaerophilales bacterium]|nr:HNH endonuclease signature motif containing protein [Candidatus Gastranaerophilales bacterium]
MIKILHIIIILILLISQIQLVYAGELCDCFGECINIYQRDVKYETKRLVKNMFGYPPYARIDIDHKIPLCLGGTNNIDNLQPLSKVAHKKKTEHDLLLLYYVKSCLMTIKEAREETSNWK